VTDLGRGGFPRLANLDAALFRLLDGPRGGDGAAERLALLLAPRRVAPAGVGAPFSCQVLSPAGVPLLRARAR
jgi:hypothetical protein